MGKTKFLIIGRKQLYLALGVILSAAVVIAGGLRLVPAAVPTAASERRLPIYCTDRSDKVVSLTFDAAWGAEDTPVLIDILGRYGVQATFFVVGAWVDQYPDAVKALADAGHEVMNHSDTHPHMPQLGKEEMKAEIEACNDKVEAVTGVRPILHRPPYGDYCNELIETVESLSMYAIQWDVDSLDWKNPTPEDICERVTSRVKSGSIVLFHNAAVNTPEALPRVIENLKQQGYSFLKVSDMIYRDGYTMAPDGTQKKAA